MHQVQRLRLRAKEARPKRDPGVRPAARPCQVHLEARATLAGASAAAGHLELVLAMLFVILIFGTPALAVSSTIE